jgi:flavorubredoxin
VLIDTVWLPFAKEFVDNLEAEVGLENIDFIVQNHAEVDHSGALPELLRRRPGLPIYCTANGVKSIKGQYHQDWDFRVVKTGDSADIGNGKKLVFVEAPMLHWPDSMFTYLAGSAVLFPNDAFGQHYASELLFNDLVDQDELWTECIKYYANILTPFSPLVAKKIQEVVGMNLPVEVIAPSHGIIWRKDPLQIVTKTDKNDVITDIFRSKAVLAGSPTVNKGILSAMAGILEEIEGLHFRGKKAAAFGCYGWSGEGPKVLAERLAKGNFQIVGEGLKCLWVPDAAGLEAARDYGRKFVKAIGL